MNPVNQTITGKHGNCFPACLASLFECPLEHVPNFFDIAGDDDSKWWASVREWLGARGFGVMFLELRSPEHLKLFDGYIIVSGKSCRDLEHATIWRDGVMVHDPHPDKCGIIEPDGIDMIYPLDPARLKFVAEAK